MLAMLQSVLAAPSRRFPGRSAGRRSERGATVLEWALIAAAVVLAASVVGAVIFRVVDTKTAQLDDCASKDVRSECGGGGPSGG